MNQHKYAGLWLLLAVALAIVAAFSFHDKEISVFDHTFKKAPIAETLLKPRVENVRDSMRTDSIRIELEKKVEEAITDTLPQSLFIFGDSMTFNLALRLAQYARQNGHTIHSINWDSSNTKIWAEHDTLKYYIAKYHPTQIFISLGSNEIYYRNPEVRKPYVEKILAIIDTIPYVWIGPPNWKEDTGINDMLERLCRPGTFFRSEGMTFERKADNIHPTRNSSAKWVDSIMRWLPHSAHPFIAEVPSDSISKRSNPNILFIKALNK